jgi:hypothetical protein
MSVVLLAIPVRSLGWSGFSPVAWWALGRSALEPAPTRISQTAHDQGCE